MNRKKVNLRDEEQLKRKRKIFLCKGIIDDRPRTAANAPATRWLNSSCYPVHFSK